MKSLNTLLILMMLIPSLSFSEDDHMELFETQALERSSILKEDSTYQGDFQSMEHNLFLDESIEAMRQMGIDDALIDRMRSGDIVGNGGGALEADFIYAYSKIPKIINDCLDTHLCRVNDEQRNLLRRIRTIAINNQNKADKLIFLNEATAPGFFEDEHDPGVRFAKTGFNPDAPIFVNLDVTYLGNNSMIPTLVIFSILIHEIGHQAGVRSHAYLDDLGTKIRNYLNEEKIKAKIGVDGRYFSTNVYNFKNRFEYSEINVSFMGLKYELGQRVLDKATCSQGRKLTGYTIENLYHQRVIKIQETFVVPMKAWIKIFCIDENATFWPEEKDLSLDFKIEKRFIPPGLRYVVENITIKID